MSRDSEADPGHADGEASRGLYDIIRWWVVFRGTRAANSHQLAPSVASTQLAEINASLVSCRVPFGGRQCRGGGAELGLITGECGEAVAVRDVLDPGDEGSRRGGVSRSHKAENAAGECS